MRIYPHKEKLQSADGYVLIYMPEHPRSRKNRVQEHIVVWEAANKRPVPNGYVIHHINGIKTDNRIDNLCLMSRKEHIILHNKLRKHSEETKSKLSIKAKERLRNPTKHPLYLSLDIDAINADRAAGMSVKNICQKYGICKYTYYTRITDYRRKK